MHGRPVLPSFPVRERGLKSDSLQRIRPILVSFPVWERGLKSVLISRPSDRFLVVPRVGTWIEIHEQECFKQIGIVVSLTEIRIKILKLQWEK